MGKMIIGVEEWCAFPALAIPAIKARVDSGAKTSALHATHIHTFKRAGLLWVRFDVHPLQRNAKLTRQCEALVIDRRVIKNSSGSSEKRYVIKTALSMAEQSWDVELTLTNRDSMGYRMLLGREAMIQRMLIDPAGSFYLGKIKKNQLHKLYEPDS